MRQQIEVEPISSVDEYAQMADWMARLHLRNAVEDVIFNYPSLMILKASRGDENKLYMPVQQCYVYESLAINPDNSAADIAESLKAIFAVLHFKAKTEGKGESYFLCSDAETCKFAEHQGLENVTYNERMDELVKAAEAVVNAQISEPMEQAQALGRLDIALNEYKRNPGLKLYRKRHIRPKKVAQVQEFQQMGAAK